MKPEYQFSQPVVEPASGIVFRRSCNVSTPTARVLLLHGVGSNETDLAGLAEHLPVGLEIFLLRGPVHVGPQGFAWYQVTFTNNGPSFSFEQAEASRHLLKLFVGALDPLPTVVAGFSQGGIMSASLGITEPELFAGFGMFSSRILQEIKQRRASPNRLQVISGFIAHGYRDAVLPLEWAKEADAWLTEIDVKHEIHLYDMAHEICAKEIADFSTWLIKTLPLTQ